MQQSLVTASYHNIGNAYFYGRGVEKSEKKAMHYWELAAMGGVVEARHNLGLSEANKSNHERAIKHFMIAVGSGYNDSLRQIKQLYTNGCAVSLRTLEMMRTTMYIYTSVTYHIIIYV